MYSLSASKIILSLLLASLFLGLSHIAFLPPWEGFDETAHFSYIQQLADWHTLPRQDTARISADVESFRTFLPGPYSSTFPVEKNGGLTYRTFFTDSPDTLSRAAEAVHAPPRQSREFHPGLGSNWQAQHPPLYYLVMVPFYSVSRDWSWGGQLFFLRTVSYLIAWSALVVGLIACIRIRHRYDVGEKTGNFVAMGVVAWPIFVPSWYPEMARLGNDSLCAFIVALLLYQTVCAFNRPQLIRRDFFVVGVVLALGCLSKAFFVPVTAGTLCLWSYVFLTRQRNRSLSSLVPMVSSALLPLLILASWWYLANWLEVGNFIGSVEMIQLTKAGGLAAGLKTHFSIVQLVRGHLAFIGSLGWCGSWSLARPPVIFVLPMAIFIVGVGAAYLLGLRDFPHDHPLSLPLWVLTPVLLGFSYHILVRVAMTGQGIGTSGYYLHFAAVLLGIAFGLGFGVFARRLFFRRSAVSLLLYSLGLSLFTSWAQILLFAGISFQQGDSKVYRFPDVMPAWLGIPSAMARLQILAFPELGAAFWIVGTGLVLLGLAYVPRLMRWRG